MIDVLQQNGEPAPPSFTLGQFIAEAGRAIRQTLPKQVWVEAVILEAKPGKHGLSLELVEAFADSQNNASLRTFLSSRAKASIEADMGTSLDAATLKGGPARLLLKPTFHPQYHL